MPRPDPVQIAENVVYAWSFAFLKQDGTYWTWSQNDPTPQQVLEGVIAKSNGNQHLHDGRLVVRFGFSNESVFDNVRIPLPLIFTNVNGTVYMTVEELVQPVFSAPVEIDNFYEDELDITDDIEELDEEYEDDE